jgi:hypothetical protein
VYQVLKCLAPGKKLSDFVENLGKFPMAGPFPEWAAIWL